MPSHSEPLRYSSVLYCSALSAVLMPLHQWVASLLAQFGFGQGRTLMIVWKGGFLAKGQPEFPILRHPLVKLGGPGRLSALPLTPSAPRAFPTSNIPLGQ